MSDFEQPDRRSGHLGARILLVDDSELNREIIGRVLTASGYAVDVASDGAEACEATWDRAYDLVLMDIEMPGMNGFEAAARIRAREGVMSGVKIVALTATRQLDAKQISFWAGIDAFIAKPIASAPLLAKVAALIPDGGAAPDDWKPVWRLATFAAFADELETAERDRLLQKFSARLDEAEAAIHAKASYADDFLPKIHALHRQASVMGFEEIAGLCALLEATRGEADARCRDPNFLGAIDRARYAISVYTPEPEPEPSADWWARMRVNVQSLFRGRPTVVPQAAAYQAFGAPAFPG